MWIFYGSLKLVAKPGAGESKLIATLKKQPPPRCILPPRYIFIVEMVGYY